MQKLNELLKTHDDLRDFNWDEKFFKNLSESKLKILSETPQQGPDAFPYLLCETLSDVSAGDNTTDFQNLIHWLYTRGIGLVINPQRQPNPDYVFTYGMIWSFKQTGYFIQPQPIKNKITENQFIVASPTEDYLPKYVRQILKDFFRDQMVLQPKILIASNDSVNFDLCFSIESLGTPPEKEYNGICEAISWFLPPHYNITLLSEKSFPQFELL